MPTSLAEALDFSASGKECTLRLTTDIAFGSGMVSALDGKTITDLYYTK